MQATETTLTLLLVWVLWEKTLHPPHVLPFEPLEGYDTKEACDRRARSRLDEIKAGKQQDGSVTHKAESPFGYSIFDSTGTLMLHAVEWRCLPESVDPRR